ncbi:hypothetical protein [Sphaerochaeta globosa]|uniref:Uncharacterized protein n=1 Tax=Sphaerochaeta globosa (strain ATCC BAA-1886 / DSM 22777 / Buddy) TaxID=158189 RepID=F0RWR4_SPHGB|nr:hypothetical protein [Sphaerochaeta globosa]ADY13695.1 hypothetical protein SpiBuddy_1871 [Sphaerochaeta globosa str. Buddy]
MSSFIKKAFGAIVGVLLLFLGIERRKNKKQKEKIVKQEGQIAHEQEQNEILETTHTIKDDLTKKKEELSENREDVTQKISEIPEEKEVEVSDEVKKLAAEQSALARVRAERLQNSRNKN